MKSILFYICTTKLINKSSMENKMEKKLEKREMGREKVRLRCLELAVACGLQWGGDVVAGAAILERYVREGEDGFCAKVGMPLRKAVDAVYGRSEEKGKDSNDGSDGGGNRDEPVKAKGSGFLGKLFGFRRESGV